MKKQRHPCLALIGVKQGNPFAIGTGFLVRWQRRLHVVTAAHVPSNSPRFNNFSIWAPDVSVCPDENGSVGLVTLLESGEPKFRFKVDNNRAMYDMMAFEVPDREWPQRIYDISNPPAIEDSGRLVAYGFPDEPPKLRPYWPPNKIDGYFASLSGSFAFTSLPIRQGHSGGPVLSKGVLVGMMIGSDNGTIVPARLLRTLFD